MYQNYSREALIELVQHQQRLLEHRSEPFFTCPPTILCPKDMSKSKYFLELFSETLKAAKDFEKEIDISAWLSKKEYYNISEADLFYHLAFTHYPAFDKAANTIFSPYINHANADNQSYTEILHFLDACIKLFSKKINEHVIELLLFNIKKIKNSKERHFFEKYLRDSIISSSNYYIFININKTNPDILNLKEHPESLVFFNFTRSIIEGFIGDLSESSIRKLNDIIHAVVNTGVFDNDIIDAYHHKNTLMEGRVIRTFKERISLRNSQENENTVCFDNALIQRLELITRDTCPQ
ncbi:hypothetical protein [Serratia sp. Se-RSBMAAmG]|uniref:hypothetical protein n=1 Tax=Serratia sp. Se-RSBMAAmG TaxID=3043305 RepID=UPI0024AF24A2|nr:hypothetical protein [Serratia sp. Se-RSBMAAmG]MDI6976000.1 hypothetical protein [Serratia sp. Se-RSBMAAmG]